MPTNPTTPTANASVNRLALGVDSPRGAQPSAGGPQPFMACFCFEAEASGPFACMASICFEAEVSGVGAYCCACYCTEAE